MGERAVGLLLAPWWLTTVAATAVVVAPLLIVSEVSRRMPTLPRRARPKESPRA